MTTINASELYNKHWECRANNYKAKPALFSAYVFYSLEEILGVVIQGKKDQHYHMVIEPTYIHLEVNDDVFKFLKITGEEKPTTDFLFT